MADLDVTQDANLTSNTAPATNDRLMLIRNSDSALTDMTLSVLYSVINTLPQGMLWNGKLSVTVASNNITVALKTLAGNNPSSTDPVYVRIGDTIRTITTSLSVTKNAATNWFNSGSAELATKEIDYFAYLGYNTTDGVVIGFARIPYANRYNDFSTTTTNEKYAAISTITNAAATDYYELVGRFAATLSAGAGYTWTVPTFTANTLINRPIYETRWLSYAGQVDASNGTITTVGTVTTSYQVRGVGMNFTHDFAVTTNGTGSTYLRVTLPFSPAARGQIGKGYEFNLTADMVYIDFPLTNYAYYSYYAGAYPGADGCRIFGSCENVRLV